MDNVIFGQRFVETVSFAPNAKNEAEAANEPEESLKNDSRAVSDARNGIPAFTNELNTLKEELTAELREHIIAGNADEIVSVQERIRLLEPRIMATELREIRSAIDAKTARLIAIKDEGEILREIHNEKGQVLGKKRDELELLQREYDRVDLAMTSLELEGDNIRDERRELRSRLENHLEAATREFGGK